MKSKHLSVEVFEPPTKKHKTSVFGIRSKHDNSVLGLIYWHNAWRQYIFEPQGNCIWSAGCLSDLRDFIQDLNEKQKRNKGAKNVMANDRH